MPFADFGNSYKNTAPIGAVFACSHSGWGRGFIPRGWVATKTAHPFECWATACCTHEV